MGRLECSHSDTQVHQNHILATPRLVPPRVLTPPRLSIQCVDMERKSRVLNLRVSDHQRTIYERAAALEGTSVSALVTSAADDRAEQLLLAHSSMTVPSEDFDQLLAALDQPRPLATSLERALTEPRFENR
jgi:uncharacterized protein (DUF1778 family)